MNKERLHITNHLDLVEKKWFAIYTKYKCEKYVVDHLSKKGIEAYIPLLNVTKKYSRKVKSYQVPLINCYAFVNITKAQYVKVLETEYVFTFIKQRQNLISIPEKEIDLLRKIVGELEGNVSISSEKFVEGEQVEVISGNLTGLKGILISKHNKKEFLVELDHIGIQLNLNINPGLLRPIHKLVRV